MVTRIIRFLVVLLIVGGTIYLVLSNAQAIDLHLSPRFVVQTTVGVVLIASFLGGIFLASTISLLTSVRRQIRENRVKVAERQTRLDNDRYLEGRVLSLLGELTPARTLLEKLVRSSPQLLLPRLTLAEVYKRLGDSNRALKVLDETRALFPESIEVLYKSAEVNEALGNQVAALDNIKLLIQQRPYSFPTYKAMLLSESLGHLGEALDYYNKLGGSELQVPSDGARIAFKRIIDDNNNNEGSQHDKLIALTKRFPDALDAHLRLAQTAQQEGDVDKAAHHFLKAARITKNFDSWNTLVHFWLEVEKPEKAIAAARTAINELQGTAGGEARLLLTRLYLHYGHLDKADETLNQLSRFYSSANETSSIKENSDTLLLHQILLLRAYNAVLKRDFTTALHLHQELTPLRDGERSPLRRPSDSSSPLRENGVL
jgi:tetratricopeptide (TPR) repeat protein